MAGLSFGSENHLPDGYWKTIDDGSGEAKSIVYIWKEKDVYYGKVHEILNDERKDVLCDKCEGERKGKPVLGMTIMWDLKENDGEYDGGQILDPDNGKTYKCKMKVNEEGTELTVRGYIGFSLIGRSQVWHRVENALEKLPDSQ